MPITIYEAIQALFNSWNVVVPAKRFADSQQGNTDSWAQEIVDWMQEKCDDILAIIRLPITTVYDTFGWYYDESADEYHVVDEKGRRYRVTPEQKAFLEQRYNTLTSDDTKADISVQSLVTNMVNSTTTTANPSKFGLQVSKELNALTRGIVAMEKIQTTQDWWTKVIEGGGVYTDITELCYNYANNANLSNLPTDTVQRFPLSANTWNLGSLPSTIQNALNEHPTYTILKAYSCNALATVSNKARFGFGVILGEKNTTINMYVSGGFVYGDYSNDIIDIFGIQYYSNQYSFGIVTNNPHSGSGSFGSLRIYDSTLVQEYVSYSSDITMESYDYSQIDITKRSQIDSEDSRKYVVTGVIPDIVNTDDKERNLVVDKSLVDADTWEQGAEKDASTIVGVDTISTDGTLSEVESIINSITDSITTAIEGIIENIGLFPNANIDPEVPEGERAVQGLFTIWNPTDKQVAKLASYLWSSAFDDIIAQFKKWFSNPLDAIITLAYYPVTPQSTATGEIKLGWFASGVTGVKKIDNPKGELNCGRIAVPKKFNNFLDFSPYTKLSLYLPFIGVVQLQADDIVGGAIEVVYRWEYLTGTCIAYVNVYNGLLNGKTMYQYSGNISMQIPLTGANYSNVYSGLVGGLGTAKAVLSKGGGVAGAVAGFASSALNVKEDIQRTGSMSGNAGMLGNLRPYLIIERPIPDNPTTYNRLLGRESNTSVKIKNIKGYTECASVDLKNVRATAEEKTEIEKILLSGFYA